MRVHLFPVAVPGSFLADDAAASSAVRLGCAISSLPTERLRQLLTPAHTAPALDPPLAAGKLVAAATRSGRCIRRRRRSHRSPSRTQKLSSCTPTIRQSTRCKATFSASGKFRLHLGFSSPHKGCSPLWGPFSGRLSGKIGNANTSPTDSCGALFYTYV